MFYKSIGLENHVQQVAVEQPLAEVGLIEVEVEFADNDEG